MMLDEHSLNRAFSAYHQGLKKGPIPIQIILLFSQFPKNNSQSEAKKILPGNEFNGKIAAELLSERRCNFDLDIKSCTC